MTRKIIVFGATGKTGIKICEQLHDSQLEHSAFVRKGSENKITTENTELIYGDVLNKADIENVFKSNEYTDIVISLGSKDLKKSLIRSTGTKNIVDVILEQSIKSKIHIVSAFGVGDSWDEMNWVGKLICKVLIRNTMLDHNLQEEIVTKSLKEFHIVRPVELTNGDLTGKIHDHKEGFLPSSKISRADVAKYLVEAMLNNKNGFSSICKSNQ